MVYPRYFGVGSDNTRSEGAAKVTELIEKVNLNRVYNQLMDVLDREGVKLAAYGYSPIPALEKDGVALSFADATRTTAYDDSQPSSDYDAFVAGATRAFGAER